MGQRPGRARLLPRRARPDRRGAGGWAALCPISSSPDGIATAFDATRTALARNGPVSARAKAKALCRIGHAMARTLGWECEADLQAARLLMRQGLGIARDLGEEALTAEVLGYLSWSEHRLGYSADAKANAEESLTSARNLGDDWLIGSGLAVLGLENPAPAEQRRLHLEAMAHLQRAGDAYLCIMQTWCLAGLELADGQFEAAYAIFQEATALAEEVGSAELVYLSWDGLGEARVYSSAVRRRWRG